MARLSLLAVFAHPDDESCGSGATLARYAHEGVEVTLVCAARGENGAWGSDQSMPKERFATIRVNELDCACKALGIRHWTVLGYPDGGLALCNRRVQEEELVRWVRTVRPQVVVTCYPEGETGHPDHDTVARVTARAYLGAGHERRFPKQVRQGLAPWRPLKLYYALPTDSELVQRPGVCGPLTMLDVSSFAQTKVQAMRRHLSQKQCSQGLVEAMPRTNRWTESLCLAHSRAAPAAGAEDDLFHGVFPDALNAERTVQ